MLSESRTQLAEALTQIPEGQATAVRLRHLEQLPLAEIASWMGRTEVSVASLLKRGLAALREQSWADSEQSGKNPARFLRTIRLMESRSAVPQLVCWHAGWAMSCARTLPYAGSVVAILGQILTADPPDVCEYRADVDPDLAEICNRMIARHPSDRFATMQDVANARTIWLKQQHRTMPQPTDVSAPAAANHCCIGVIIQHALSLPEWLTQ
jgi:hypothetical protein